MQDVHDPYAALRHRDYRRLLSGSMLASVGTQMQGVAVGWELYRRTGSPLDLGLVGLVQFVPVLLLSLPAGHAADRYSRKGLLLAAQGMMALTSLGLATLSFFQGPVPLVYLCLFLAGVSRAFNAPARWSLLPEVVPPDLLTNAVTWNSSAWQVASVAGPALGGGVIWASGQRASRRCRPPAQPSTSSRSTTGDTADAAAPRLSIRWTIRPGPSGKSAAHNSMGTSVSGAIIPLKSAAGAHPSKSGCHAGQGIGFPSAFALASWSTSDIRASWSTNALSAEAFVWIRVIRVIRGFSLLFGRVSCGKRVS